MQTPPDWQKKTEIYSQRTSTDEKYGFDNSSYRKTSDAFLCWQPQEASSNIGERGRINTDYYQAVLYDETELHEGDLVNIEKIGWLEIQSIKHYLSHRHIVARSTDRRPSNAAN